MKIILLKEVENVGKPGDVITVTAGYARNYLLPRRLAAPPTPDALRRIEATKRVAARAEAAKQKEATATAKSLENASVNIPAKVGEGGHLFGSVTAADIARALQAEGRKVDESMLRLERPIKEVGIYDVPVMVHGEVRATVKVWVVEQKNKD
jgi:large subunit ribosomal protein L9